MDPFFLRIQDAVCWVIEMGETWWEIKQLFQLNLESLTDFCKASSSIIEILLYITVLHDISKYVKKYLGVGTY